MSHRAERVPVPAQPRGQHHLPLPVLPLGVHPPIPRDTVEDVVLHGVHAARCGECGLGVCGADRDVL